MDKIPASYRVKLSVRETEKAIELLREFFRHNFAANLNLHRASAPLFVEVNTGLNDNLSGSEKAVSFDISAIENCNCEIVHSLAKWKRMALGKYEYNLGEGIYTNMNAIRRQEAKLDNLHSVYVDQWDWEKIISSNQRSIEFLTETVERIYKTIFDTACYIEKLFPALKNYLPKKITFITAQELENMYPTLSPNERENKFAEEKGAIFIIGIGAVLKGGEPHDLRAPDYDDWSLNGDILIWYPILNRAVELSSMGIRVDKDSLISQLKTKNVDKLTNYHNAIINEQYPLTIGGGIGQSRLSMVLLQKAHIGEVQSSIWDEQTNLECLKRGITLL